jgi:hypothetical protein
MISIRTSDFYCDCQTGLAMGFRRFWIVTLAAFTVVAGGAAPAPASSSSSSSYEVAYWPMNEPAGARVMHDTSGHGLDGVIGSEVLTGGGYDFGRLEPDTPPPHPAHVVIVPDNAALDPGTRTFAITLRIRTRFQFGNVIQKGQATVPGGSYKLQIPNGHVQCWFRGAAGQLLVTAPHPINDGLWHTVTCARYADGLTLTVDGTKVAGKWGPTGNIANSWPLSIGGKTECDQRTVGCDYYAGDLGSVRIDAADSW